MNLMIMMSLMFALALSLSVILIFLNSFLAKKMTTDREKPSPFECGFDNKTSSRLSFSIRFFLIAVIFLIFDVEITLLIPLPFMTYILTPFWLLYISSSLILILILGLYHEWNEGSLQWM